MDTNRRSVLKASGIAALFGATGLAGCSGVVGGDSPADWQYDPSILTEARSKFYGSVEYTDLWAQRDKLPPSVRQGLDRIEETDRFPFAPSDLGYSSGVGGFSVVTSAGIPALFTSTATTGSFTAEEIQETVSMSLGISLSDNPLVEAAGSHGGYTIYRMRSPGEGGGGGTGSGDSAEPAGLSSPSMGDAAFGIDDGAVVAGNAASFGPGGITAEQTVRMMIDAGGGGGVPSVQASNEHLQGISGRIGGDTFRVAASFDPAAVTLVTTLNSAALSLFSGLLGTFDPTGASAAATSVAEDVLDVVYDNLRGIGLGVDVGDETTTITFVLSYNWADSARSTGLVQIFDLAGTEAETSPAIDSFDAEYDGREIVVEATGPTERFVGEAVESSAGGDGLTGRLP